jgi:nucleoside-diphosphate-sugar epimerase
MRVFVTGATGFIGSAVVRELLGAGHQVTGLARSDRSAKSLIAAGAQVVRGDIEDLKALSRGASEADGAIHTAFYHALGHIPLATRLRVLVGGSPGGIVKRFLDAAVGADRRAIETLGRALEGRGGPLLASFGTLSLKAGQLATEDDAPDPESPGAPRGDTEGTIRDLGSRGVRAMAIRLAPLVHDLGDRAGLASMLFKTARKKGSSAYVGEGLNRWPSVHRLDAARLFRLALERGDAGASYHAVAEEGLPFRKIAEAIARQAEVPAVSIPLAEAPRRFSFLSLFVPIDNPTSSALTQERLGWTPSEPGLFSDLDKPEYFGT